MNELLSCRNCIHNCAQSLTIGPGTGFCLRHKSVIPEPERTTCKYLHRKDLPHFVIDEGTREHAAEFAGFPRLVTLDDKQPIERIQYSERYNWQQKSFDPITHAVAQYFKVRRKWVLISAFAGGVDGRRSLAHSCLVRHYMDHCGTWTSSYRLVLGIVQEIDAQPGFGRSELSHVDGANCDLASEALWDVVFVRLSAVQEYGWHAGLETLMWASDAVDGALADLNWPRLQDELAKLRTHWVESIIEHAREHDAFFPAPEERPAEAHHDE